MTENGKISPSSWRRLAILAALASKITIIAPANALITRDYAYLKDNHLTARYGNTTVK